MTAQIIPHPAAVPLIDMARAAADEAHDAAWIAELEADALRLAHATANRRQRYAPRFLRWAGITIIILALIAAASVLLADPLAKARHDAAMHEAQQ